MHIDNKTSLEIRRHAPTFAKKIHLRDDGVDIHTLEWRALNDLRSETIRTARVTIDKIKDDMSEKESRSVEDAYEGIMEIYEDIEAEKDYRTMIGEKGPRADESRSNGMRPMSSDNSVYRGDGAEDYDGTRDSSEETFVLRADQSYVDYVRRHNPDRGTEYRGLTDGAYLRAMVAGPKTETERRALNEGSDSAGGYTVPDILSARLIDRMRSASVVLRAGAQIVPLHSDKTTVAKIASDPVPGWRFENAPIVESEPTFSAVTFTPRSLAMMVRVSRELLEDSLNIENALPQIIAEAMAAELDRVVLLGSGTAPEPRGVRNFSGLTTSDNAVGNLVAWKPLMAARTALRTIDSDVTAFVMHPAYEGRLAELTDSTGQPMRMPPALERVPMLTTTKIPTNLGTGTNESIIVGGDWRRLLIGVRTSLKIEIFREIFAENYQYAFGAVLRADAVAEHDKAFTVLKGVKLVA